MTHVTYNHGFSPVGCHSNHLPSQWDAATLLWSNNACLSCLHSDACFALRMLTWRILLIRLDCCSPSSLCHLTLTIASSQNKTKSISAIRLVNEQLESNMYRNETRGNNNHKITHQHLHKQTNALGYLKYTTTTWWLTLCWWYCIMPVAWPISSSTDHLYLLSVLLQPSLQTWFEHMICQWVVRNLSFSVAQQHLLIVCERTKGDLWNATKLTNKKQIQTFSVDFKLTIPYLHIIMITEV